MILAILFAEKEHIPQSNQSAPLYGEFPVQTKLEIGSKDDPQEKEADAVAEKVMRKTEAGGKTSGGGDEPVVRMQHEEYDDDEKVQMKHEDYDGPIVRMQHENYDGDMVRMQHEDYDSMKEDEEKVQKKEEDEEIMKVADPGGAEGGTATPQFQSQLDSSKGSGHALPDHIQNDFGKATGNDLSDVKVHTDSNAHNMAQSIHAKAFTHGQDIYFKQGQYNPNTESGKQLIYHESHHTVQQSGGVQRKVQRQYYPPKGKNKKPKVVSPYVKPADETYPYRDDYKNKSETPYNKPGTGSVSLYGDRYESEKSYAYDMAHDDRPAVEYGKVFVYRRDMFIKLKDGRSLSIVINGETFCDGKATDSTKGHSIFKYEMTLDGGSGKAISKEISLEQDNMSMLEAIDAAAKQGTIPARLLEHGTIDDAFMATAKQYMDSLMRPATPQTNTTGSGPDSLKSKDTMPWLGQDSLQPAQRDSLGQSQDWDKMSEADKRALAWKEVWEKTSMSDMVLPLIVGVILGIVMLILSFFASPAVIIGVLVAALIALIVMFISEYSNAKDDEEKSYIISRYAVYILAAIAGILIAIFAPEMLAMAAMLIGIIALVASVVIGLVYLMRRIDRAVSAPDRQTFEKETDQGANIVENTIVDVVLFIITSLLPKFGTRLAPKPGTSFRDWINPFKRSTPPGTPPAGGKANNTTNQSNKTSANATQTNTGIRTNASRIQASSLKEFKALVNQLSKPGSKLTQLELDQLRILAQKYGGLVRVDLTGVKGTGVNPHAHVEGLGSSVEARHIWLDSGVK